MPAIGIDLGTHLFVSSRCSRTADPEFVETPEGNELTHPLFTSGSAVSVGADAKKQMADDPDNVVGNKRYMGKDYPQNMAEVPYTRVHFPAIIPRRLAEEDAGNCGQEPTASNWSSPCPPTGVAEKGGDVRGSRGLLA